MDEIKYAVFTYKSTQLLGKNQYTSNVESGSTRREIKHWVELLFCGYFSGSTRREIKHWVELLFCGYF